MPQAADGEPWVRSGLSAPALLNAISLELGGSNDITNLWPEPYDWPWNAHMKHALENKLHQMVCAGQITMQEAQQTATDWISAYQRYVGG